MHRCSYISIFIILLSSCLEPYPLEVQNYDRVLVIHGGITNQLKHHEVTLHFTRGLDADRFEFVSDAEVVVMYDGGEHVFSHQQFGTYASELIAGEIGQTYRLKVVLANGETYESAKQHLLASREINRLYGLYQPALILDDQLVQSGVQLFLDSALPNEEAFFRYTWNEVYAIEPPFPSFFYLDRETNEILPREGAADTLKDCFRKNLSSDILIATASKQRNIREFPIRFLSQDSLFLRTRYAINVTQHRISSDAFSYYRALKENNQSVGTLFDTQRGEVIGNLINTHDPADLVLGFFEVSTVSEKRLFLKWSDVEGFLQPSYPVVCAAALGNVHFTNKAGAIELLRDQGSEMLIHSYNENLDEATVVESICGSCRHLGNTTKPAYW